VTAQYTINQYTVTFKDWNGTTLSSQSVNYGSAATAPGNPSRTGYTFTGWDVPFNHITADLTVTAQYTINSYMLSYTTDGNGTISGNPTQLVTYGNDGAAVTAVPSAGYNFDHWSDNNSTSATRQDTNVSGDISAKAIFVPETQLVFTLDPGSVTAGGGATSAEVSIEDASNRVVPSDTTTQISIVDSLCGTTLATATVNAGVAQFTNLRFHTVSTNRHLHAISSPVLTSADSTAFNVLANSDWLFWNGFETCVP
jgi:hypothetical protein